MLLDELEKLADKKIPFGDSILYIFNEYICVKSPKVEGIYTDAFYDYDEEELRLAKGLSSLIGVIPKEDFQDTRIHIRGE